MAIHCPNCYSIVPSDRLNIPDNLGQCQICSDVFLVADAVERGYVSSEIDLKDLPKGVQFSENSSGFELKISTRSLVALGSVPVFLFVAAIPLVIIIDSVMEGTFSLWISLVCGPIWAVALGLGVVAAMQTAGSVELIVEGDQATLHKGVARIGIWDQFSWGQVKTIVLDRFDSGSSARTSDLEEIIIRENRDIGFYSGVDGFQLKTIRDILREMLYNRNFGGKNGKT